MFDEALSQGRVAGAKNTLPYDEEAVRVWFYVAANRLI
jgi:hypothetical protein